MSITLRPYQEEAVQSLFDFFAAHGGTDAEGKPIPANPVIVMPTGTGKSLIIGEFIRRAFQHYPNTRAMMITHVKELINQNAQTLRKIWPQAPLGIYSAGMGTRDTVQPIIFGGIKSVVGKYPVFGYRDFLIIDEGHLISPNGEAMYQKFIFELRAKNPYLKIIMLTATPYRVGLGLLTNGNIATHVAFDLSTSKGFVRLLAEGYLSPLIPKKTVTQIDISNVSISASNGDYKPSELQAAVDKKEITYSALKELMEYSQDRHCGLIFASGIEHAEHIGDMLGGIFGQSYIVIHSKKTDKENDASLKAWKAGKVKWAVNMNSLTTGVDNPQIDVIGMLRPTASTGLWVQMLGRGTRPCIETGKVNCLVLDFAGNTRRLGPIDDPVIPRKRGEGPPGDAPVKLCPKCGTYNHSRAPVCIGCGEAFTFAPKLNSHSSNEDLIRSDLPEVEYFDVSRAVYTPHVGKESGRSSIQVAYFCNSLRTFYEWITVEGEGFASKRGRDWFRQRYAGEPPATNAEVLSVVSFLRPPRRIRVHINKKYPEILGYEF